MTKNEIAVKKDFLVITRREGRFHRFFWFRADIYSLAEVEKKIVDFNETCKEKKETAKLVTNKLVKEVCAYRKRSMPLEDLIKDAKEVRENIDEAVGYLEAALSDLNRIR